MNTLFDELTDFIKGKSGRKQHNAKRETTKLSISDGIDILSLALPEICIEFFIL